MQHFALNFLFFWHKILDALREASGKSLLEDVIQEDETYYSTTTRAIALRPINLMKPVGQ
jgi:hypothetical protein